MSNQKDQIEQTNLPIRRPRKIPNSQWAEMRTAFAAGIGLRELARQLGIPAGTVLARAKRENWSGHIKQATTLVPIERQSETMSVAQAVTLTMADRGQRHVERMADVAEKVMPHVRTMEPGAILDRIEDIDRLDKVARRTFGLEDGSRHVGIDLRLNCMDVSLVVAE